MSFAPTKKKVAKKPGKSPQKPKSSQSIEESSENEAQRNRIILLQDIVAKLQMQHDMFEPLLSLLTRASDVMQLEEQAKSFLDQANQLEQKIESQHSHAKQIERKTAEVFIPPSLSEGQGAASRPLPQMLNAVTDMEANVQAISMKRKVNAKKQEVSSKEQFIKTLEGLQTDLSDAQLFIKEQTNTFVKEKFEKLNALEEKGEKLKERQQQDQTLIQEALEKHALFGGETGEGWLQDELNQRVQQALDDLSKHLEYNYKQLEVMFKQSLMSLKNTYQKVLTDQFAIFAMKKETQEFVDGKVEAVKNLQVKLENTGKAQFATCKDVSNSINESLVQLNDKARRFVKSYRAAAAEEKKEMYANGKVDFEQWLLGIWFNIDLLRENVHKLTINITADLHRISECLLELQQQSPQRHAELAPKANVLKTSLLSRIEESTVNIEELRRRLFGIWKALNREADLDIEFMEKQEGDRQAFEDVSEMMIDSFGQSGS